MSELERTSTRETRILERLVKQYPSVDEKHLAALAEVWSIERDRIINRMLEISRQEIGQVPPDAKAEAIFRLADLTLGLEECIIEKKTENVLIENIDPNQERSALQTQTIQERLENTVRSFADTRWKKLIENWSRRFPILVECQESRRRSRNGRRLILSRELSGVKNQHFSPSFSNEFWATGQQKLIRIYERGVDQCIRSRDRGYTTWGQEMFLYSQPMERLFQLIEGDAQKPYTNSLKSSP